MFNEKSGMVQIVLNRFKSDPNYTIDDVPNLSNLRDVVQDILDEKLDRK